MNIRRKINGLYRYAAFVALLLLMVTIMVVRQPVAHGITETFILDDIADYISPTGYYTFTGKGCISKGIPGHVKTAIGDDQDNIATLEDVRANTDGSWSLTVDMAQVLQDAGGNTKIDPWHVYAQCVYYANASSGIEEKIFQLTRAKNVIQYDQDPTTSELTNLRSEGSGYNSDEALIFKLITSDAQGGVTEGAPDFVVGTATVDAAGTFNAKLTVPSDVPDGYYVIGLKSPGIDSSTTKVAYWIAGGRVYLTKPQQNPPQPPANPGQPSMSATPSLPLSHADVTRPTGADTATKSTTASSSANTKTLADTGGNWMMVVIIGIMSLAVGGFIWRQETVSAKWLVAGDWRRLMREWRRQ